MLHLYTEDSHHLLGYITQVHLHEGGGGWGSVTTLAGTLVMNKFDLRGPFPI